MFYLEIYIRIHYETAINSPCNKDSVLSLCKAQKIYTTI